jgi:hypothetical protein
MHTFSYKLMDQEQASELRRGLEAGIARTVQRLSELHDARVAKS